MAQVRFASGEEEVNSNLERIVERSFKEVWDFNQDQGVSLRLGAYMLTVDKVVGAVRAQGYSPRTSGPSIR